MKVYILYGDDKFNINRRIDIIKDVIEEEWKEFSYCSMPDDSDYLTVINELLTKGLGTGKKIVQVFNDCLFNKDAKKAIKKLESAPDDNVLIIATTKKTASNLVVIKELLKHGKLEEYRLIPVWKTSDIADYIKHEAISYKLNLDDECINYLVDNIGNDTQFIDSELKKIALYAISSKISIKGLHSLITSNNANSIELAKHCLYGESKQAFDKLNQLKSNHPLQIVATLSSCFRTWLAVKAGVAENASDNEIAKAGCIHNPKRIYFLKQEVFNCSLMRLRAILSVLTNLEYELKTGKNTLTPRIIEICKL